MFPNSTKKHQQHVDFYIQSYKQNVKQHEEAFVQTLDGKSNCCVTVLEKTAAVTQQSDCSDNTWVHGRETQREREWAEEQIYFSLVSERWGWVSFLPKHPKSSPAVRCPEDLQLCSASPSPIAVTRAERWSNKKSHFLKMSQQPSKQTAQPQLARAHVPAAAKHGSHPYEIKKLIWTTIASPTSTSLCLRLLW